MFQLNCTGLGCSEGRKCDRHQFEEDINLKIEQLSKAILEIQFDLEYLKKLTEAFK